MKTDLEKNKIDQEVPQEPIDSKDLSTDAPVKKKSKRVRELEKNKLELSEENIKLKIIINEMKKKIASLEAERKKKMLQEGSDSATSLQDAGMKELQRIMASESIEMEIAGLIGEREYFRERIEELNTKFKRKRKRSKWYK